MINHEEPEAPFGLHAGKDNSLTYGVGLILGYLGHLSDKDGVSRPVIRGINCGSPLSPLMGALYLRRLDETMEKEGVFYARYMDDWVVMTNSRWALRRAVRRCNRVLDTLKVEKHPFKTFIGRIAHGFDFLGYRIEAALGSGGGALAWPTLRNHLDKVTRLYEQGADAVRIGDYVRHWWRWGEVWDGVKVLNV